MLLAFTFVMGCNKPQSTVMTADDYQFIASEMAAKLREHLSESPLFSARTPESPKWTIAIQKVQNLTSDMMPESAKWYLMARVRESVPIGSFSRERNIAFTIPAERLREARKRGAVSEDMEAGRKPTHVMSATFLSVTRASGQDRTDLYYCEYTLNDLKTGEVIWTDKVEFKRAAHGRSWD